MNKQLGILMFFAALINIGIAVFVFKKNQRNILNKTFAGLGIMCGLWNLDLAGLYYTTSFEFANLWSLILRPAILVGLAVIFHFSLVLSKNFSKINKKILKFAYIIGTSLSILNWLGIGKKDVVLKQWGYFPQIDTIYVIFILCFTIVGYGLYLIFKRYKTTANPVEKNQLKYFFAALYINILMTATGFLTLLNLKIYPVGNFATLAYSGIIAYAIVKHQLMDIKIVIKKSVIYTALITFITATYVSSIFLIQLILGSLSITAFLLSAILSSLIISITLEQVKNIFDRLTDKIFFKSKYNHQIVLNEITNSINSVTNIEDLQENVSRILKKHLHIHKVLFLLKENLQGSKLISFVEEKNELLIYDDTLSDEIKKEMEFYGAIICAPLLLKKTFVGLFAVGNKMSQDMFSMDDLLLLEIVSREISIVFENIKLFSEIQRKERLVTIGTMSSAISHEIRNPLTSISTFVQILSKKYNDEDFMKEFNRIVPFEIERLKILSENLLMFSKVTSKFEKININEIIEKTVNIVEGQFKKKRAKIIKELNGIPEIHCDSSQLLQVFINLSLNSLESLQNEGFLKISTKLYNDNLNIKFEDNGTGIDDKYIGKIFEPFFTTKEEGSGLGLAICKRIIEAHNGTIKVESELMKGSVFNIILPEN